MANGTEERALQGDIEAAKELAETAYKRKDYKQAIKWYEIAANRGDGYAAYSLGHIYFESGPYEDNTKAVHWFKIGAEQGEADAQYKLALLYATGRGGLRTDYVEAARLCRLAANQDHPDAIASVQKYEFMASKSGSSCLIATACTGPNSDELSVLRGLRDAGMSGDRVLRDFFHVFWSRYYEYSPGLARLAQTDANVARHIRWTFLEPWFAWMEIVTRIGLRSLDTMDRGERDELLSSLGARVRTWVAQLPEQLEGKRPETDGAVFDAFESFRQRAYHVWLDRNNEGEDGGPSTPASRSDSGSGVTPGDGDQT